MTTYPETGRLSAPAESPLVIKNVRLYGEGEPTDVVVKDGIIATIGAPAEAEDAQVIDGQGNVLLPGLVDMHVHLREPGREDTETIETGSKAAAKGGFTAVFTMANTNPVTDQPIIAESVWAKSQALALCDVHPVGSITKGLEGKTLTEFGMMARSDAKVRMFSDDGKCVQDPQLMRRALEYAKGMDVLLAQHAEDDRMTGGASAHDGLFRVNPPLREQRDTEALREALLNGTIDCVATDHAPHGSEDKCVEFENARPGMLGLESSLAVIAKIFVETGLADWRFVARVMSERPAEITRLPGHGRPIAEGEPANLTIVDPDHHWVSDSSTLASKSENNPYAGEEFGARVTHTILRGAVTFDLAASEED